MFEHDCISDTFSKNLLIENIGLIQRGHRDLRPKSIDIPKLLVSLIRQVNGIPTVAESKVHIFATLDALSAYRLTEFLWDLYPINIYAPAFGSLFSVLKQLQGRSVLTVACDMESESGAHQNSFARTLLNHDIHLESRLARDLVSRSKVTQRSSMQEFDEKVLTIEERSGKFSTLSIEDASLKYSVKRWSSLIASHQKDALRPPLETGPGFGVGGLVLQEYSDSHRGGQKITLSMAEVKLPDSLSLDAIKILRECVSQWLLAQNLTMLDLKRVYISVPWLSVSAFVGESFSKDCSQGVLILHPDQVYGWQPLVSFLSMVRQPEIPSLFVHCHHRHNATLGLLRVGS